MHPAQIAETSPSTDREMRDDEDIATLPLADKLMMLLFLFFVALFGLISVVELAASPFR